MLSTDCPTRRATHPVVSIPRPLRVRPLLNLRSDLRRQIAQSCLGQLRASATVIARIRGRNICPLLLIINNDPRHSRLTRSLLAVPECLTDEGPQHDHRGINLPAPNRLPCFLKIRSTRSGDSTSANGNPGRNRNPSTTRRKSPLPRVGKSDTPRMKKPSLDSVAQIPQGGLPNSYQGWLIHHKTTSDRTDHRTMIPAVPDHCPRGQSEI